MSPDTKKLYRSRSNRMILGVCGGLGDFFGIDPSLMRLLFVIGTLFGFGSFIFIYLAMFIIVPEEPMG
jgi:phage shock protein C